MFGGFTTPRQSWRSLELFKREEPNSSESPFEPKCKDSYKWIYTHDIRLKELSSPPRGSLPAGTILSRVWESRKQWTWKIIGRESVAEIALTGFANVLCAVSDVRCSSVKFSKLKIISENCCYVTVKTQERYHCLLLCGTGCFLPLPQSCP